jgi:WD40 repeat protein
MQRGVPASTTQVAFASDGKFAFADGNKITLCSAGSKKSWRIATNEWPPLAALALSPNGEVLATRSFDNPQVHLWEATGIRRQTLGSPVEEIGDLDTEAAGVIVPDMAFSPDGRCLAGAGPRRQLCLWDVARGNLLWEVPPQTGLAIERFAFSPSGHILATLQADRTVTLYEAVSGVKCGQLGEADPKNRRVYLAYNYYGRSRLAQTRRVAPVCLAFSPDGRYLAVAKDTLVIHLWDILAGREIGQLTGHQGGVVSLLFSPDGKRLISGSTDTTTLTWDLSRFTSARRAPADFAVPKSLDALWTDLADPDATRAFDAIRRLFTSPDQAVNLIQERVLPATLPDPQRLTQLLADLESDRFELRRQAEAELLGLGEWAEPALRKLLADDPPLDLRQRLERLLDKLARQVQIAGRMRDLRAVELLELIGSSQARQTLQSLAGGAPGARLTREAKSALERLTKLAVAH